MWPLQTRDCLRTWPVAPCLWPHTAKMEKKQRRQDKEWQMWTRAALSNEGKQRSTPQTLWKGDIGGIQCSLHIVDILWSLPNDMSFVVSLWILTICRMLLSVISLRWLSSNELVAFIAIIETDVCEKVTVCVHVLSLLLLYTIMWVYAKKKHKHTIIIANAAASGVAEWTCSSMHATL